MSLSDQSFDTPLWPGPRLLVPIQLESLVIGTPNQSGSWADLALDYTKLASANAVEQPPFTTLTGSALPQPGVHLQATLPAGFRNGQQDPATGDVTFPAIPNRWLFLRWITPSPGAAPEFTATILQSDYLGAVTDGTNSYPDPSSKGQVQYVGKSYDLSAWTNPDGPTEPVLRSMGPGSVTWTSIYQNTRNVLCFHDDLAGIAAGTVSYAAFGWYWGTSFDPVLGQNTQAPTGFDNASAWQDIVEALQFTLGDTADVSAAQAAWKSWQSAHKITPAPKIPAIQESYPAQSLCHGMVYGIDWTGPNSSYPRDKILQGDTALKVAVGGTGFEAISAWLADTLQQPKLQDLLLALQQDQVFDYLSEPSIFQDKSLAARFPRRDGGITYSVVAAQSNQSRGNRLQTVALSAAQTTKLTELQANQSLLDKTQQAIDTALQTMSGLVYKFIQSPPDPFGGGDDRNATIAKEIDALVGGLEKLNADKTKYSSDVAASKSDLTTALGTDFDLKSTGAERFNTPAAPSIMIAGAKQDSRFLPTDADGSGEDHLRCRITGQTVSALTVVVPGHGATTVTADDLSGRAVFPVWKAGLPKEMGDLIAENVLFDPGQAQFLAKLAYGKAGVSNPTAAELSSLAGDIQKQQAAPFTATPDTDYTELVAATAVGFTGVAPLKRAVQAYVPAWSPVYVDWKVTFYPSSSSAATMLDNWSLDGMEFDWTGTAIPNGSEVISGRTVLGTQIIGGLAAKLDAFTTQDPNFQDLPGYQQTYLTHALAQIEKSDVITASLEGLGWSMLQMTSQMTQLVYNNSSDANESEVQDYVNAGQSLVPVPGQAGVPGFYPLRAGHFVINELSVVDTFGQVLLASNAGVDVTPILSRSVTTSGTGLEKYAQLAPAVQQPSRLNLTLLDASDDAVATNSSDRTNPVCGWLLPNHLDNSVLVFDQTGAPLGEILPVLTDSGARPRWDPAPGEDVPLGAPPAIDNAHLLAFVQALLATSNTSGDAALSELLDVIDTTLWATGGTTQPADDNLTVLIGQPVAVVRAKMELQLDGSPAFNQSWDQLGKNDTGGLLDVAFDTHIGDLNFAGNGALGYFLNDDYGQLNPLQGYSATHGQLRRAVSAGGGGALDGAVAALATGAQVAATSGYVNPAPSVPLKQNGAAQMLTVLMDPRGVIPVMSGILPVVTASLSSSAVAAMNQLLATFRVGPILTDPKQVQMPFPADVAGQWSWIARSGVTTWETVTDLRPANPNTVVPNHVPSLREGWLGLVPKAPVGSDAPPEVEVNFIEKKRDQP